MWFNDKHIHHLVFILLEMSTSKIFYFLGVHFWKVEDVRDSLKFFERICMLAESLSRVMFCPILPKGFRDQQIKAPWRQFFLFTKIQVKMKKLTSLSIM